MDLGPKITSLVIDVGTKLDEAERRLVLATLDWYGGDKEAAAESLGITSRTIYNLMARYRRDGHYQ